MLNNKEINEYSEKLLAKTFIFLTFSFLFFTSIIGPFWVDYAILKTSNLILDILQGFFIVSFTWVTGLSICLYNRNVNIKTNQYYKGKSLEVDKFATARLLMFFYCITSGFLSIIIMVVAWNISPIHQTLPIYLAVLFGNTISLLILFFMMSLLDVNYAMSTKIVEDEPAKEISIQKNEETIVKPKEDTIKTQEDTTNNVKEISSEKNDEKQVDKKEGDEVEKLIVFLKENPELRKKIINATRIKNSSKKKEA